MVVPSPPLVPDYHSVFHLLFCRQFTTRAPAKLRILALDCDTKLVLFPSQYSIGAQLICA